jgi:hypothetical protein
MAGRNQTTQIKELEDKAASFAARLDVHELQLKLLSELQAKGEEASSGMTVKMAVFEERLVVLVDLKGSLSTIGSLEKDLVAFRKDLESLQKWKDELKKERDEAARRLWAFAPNLLAAIVSGVISLGVALLVVWLNSGR